MILKPFRKSLGKPFINMDAVFFLVQLFFEDPATKENSELKDGFLPTQGKNITSSQNRTYSIYGRTSGQLLSTNHTILSYSSPSISKYFDPPIKFTP